MKDRSLSQSQSAASSGGGGGLPAPLESSASYTSGFWGSVGTFLGNDSDLDQTNQVIVLGSTDTAIASNATSSVVIAGGNNTGASATGPAGGVFAQGGDVFTGSATPGDVAMIAGFGDSAKGGAASLQAGNSNTGAGGSVVIAAGNANGGTQNGGDLTFSAGTSSGGAGGNFVFVGGTGPTNGNISMRVAGAGAIQLQDTSTGISGQVWTSTDNIGSGHWAASTGGAAPPLSRTTTSISYAVLSSDQYIAVLGTAAGITLTFPTSASAGTGKQYIIKDEDGQALVKNITLKANGAELIDGSNTQIVNAAYASITLFCTGTGWAII